MNYNFTKIAEQYPKSFEALKSWIKEVYIAGQNTEDLEYNFSTSDTYLLYTVSKDIIELIKDYFNPLEISFFFDANNIHGHVGVLVDLWYYDIEDGKEIVLGANNDFSSRESALTECWNKCFEILEKKLSSICSNCKHFSTLNSNEGTGCNFCNLHSKGVDAGDTCDMFSIKI